MMLKRTLIFGIISARLLCSVAWAETAYPSSSSKNPDFAPELDRLVPELMRDYGARGVAVALIKDGRVSTSKYYGFANLERRTPVSRGTVFNTASVSKSLTATGVMALVEDGRISLDDPLFKHVHSWALPPSEFPTDEVTLARVLSHTGGLSRHTTGIWAVGDRLPTIQAALSGDNDDRSTTTLVYKPGTKWSYSGSGYSLLQLLVQETTGESFARYMTKRVLKPLGLGSSRIGWPADISEVEAQSYDEFGDPISNYRSPELGAGGWNATIDELARYAASLANVNRGHGALRKETIERMAAPAQNAIVSENTKMGLGLFIEQLRDGRTILQHTGGNPGVGALFAIDPVKGDGIAILVNRSWANHVYAPIYCAWRNATTVDVSTRENCPRDATGIVMNAVARHGLAGGKQRFDALYAASPELLSDQKTAGIIENFVRARRFAEAVAVLQWHPMLKTSAALQEALGFALFGLKDRDGAKTAWTEALRLDPSRDDAAQQLRALEQH